MIKPLGIIPALLVLAASCPTIGCAARCSVAGNSWPDHVGPWLPMPTGKPMHFELRLIRDGRIEIRNSGIGFGGGWEPISPSDLRRILGILDTLDPQPYLVVDVAPEAGCEEVRALAAELEKLSLCQRSLCVTRAAWNNYSAEAIPAKIR